MGQVDELVNHPQTCVGLLVGLGPRIEPIHSRGTDILGCAWKARIHIARHVCVCAVSDDKQISHFSALVAKAVRVHQLGQERRRK